MYILSWALIAYDCMSPVLAISIDQPPPNSIYPVVFCSISLTPAGCCFYKMNELFTHIIHEQSPIVLKYS